MTGANNLLERMKELMPEDIKYKIKLLRLRKSVTGVMGPWWKPNHHVITLVISYFCNLNCLNCNQSCRQAPSKESMSLQQIDKFIQESVENGRKWEMIRILGGEPSLHPHIFEIIERLRMYKTSYSQGSAIHLFTNGFGEQVNRVLSKLPEEIKVWNTHKTSNIQKFFSMNVAPIDLDTYRDVDYRNGCFATRLCGIGLTPYGYYQCEVAGSIDRVFGFDVGRKELPPLGDGLHELFETFCKYCGYFKHDNTRLQEEIMSPTWKHAYEAYRMKRPSLSLYQSTGI